MEGNWYDAFSPCNDRTQYFGESTCDEYPFGSTLFGGSYAYKLGGVSLRLVGRDEQNIQRDLINRFYARARIERFSVNPREAVFLTFAGAGPSWCTDRDGWVMKGCR